MDAFRKADTLTARYLRGEEKVQVPVRRRSFSGEELLLRGARGNNLKDIDLTITLKRMTAVTGVSGSGKSSLVVETLYRAIAQRFKTGLEQPLPFKGLRGERSLNGVKLIDQTPIGRSPRFPIRSPISRSFDHIRKVFADQREARRIPARTRFLFL